MKRLILVLGLFILSMGTLIPAIAMPPLPENDFVAITLDDGRFTTVPVPEKRTWQATDNSQNATGTLKQSPPVVPLLPDINFWPALLVLALGATSLLLLTGLIPAWQRPWLTS